MSLSEDVRPMLAARAATDPEAAELLEIFTRADATLREYSLERIGDFDVLKGSREHRVISNPSPLVSARRGVAVASGRTSWAVPPSRMG